MFAALQSDASRPLEYFRLALVLTHRQSQTIPAPLAENFDRVLNEARQLLSDPKSINPDISAQAVHLANDMLRASQLKDALNGVTGLCDVSPEIADRVLRSLEPAFASPDGP